MSRGFSVQPRGPRQPRGPSGPRSPPFQTIEDLIEESKANEEARSRGAGGSAGRSGAGTGEEKKDSQATPNAALSAGSGVVRPQPMRGRVENRLRYPRRTQTIDERSGAGAGAGAVPARLGKKPSAGAALGAGPEGTAAERTSAFQNVVSKDTKPWNVPVSRAVRQKRLLCISIQ